MSEETDPEAEAEINAEKKELGDLIQDIIKSLETMKDEIIDTGAYNREFIEKKIAEVIDRQSNITENQQKLFDQLEKLKEEKKE